MIIDNFNFMRTIRLPAEAHPSLVIDPDTVLPPASALQCLQPIAGRHAQFIQFYGRIQHLEFPLHDRQQVAGETPGPKALKNFPCFVTPKTLNHGR
jgi:hypothetical protein